MSSGIIVCAPAKLNLSLRVLPRRPDGYHDIESLFQEVNLQDTLQIALDKTVDGCQVVCTGMNLPCENTLTASYRVFQQLTGIDCGVRVCLDKRIPSGAGLGGGSSDAAALLKGLNTIFAVGLSESILENLAAKVGSDVPFFVKGGCALVKGRGDILRSILSRTDLSFVLISPSVHSSTKEAYSMVDDYMSSQSSQGIFPSFDELENMYYEPVNRWSFNNSFTPPLAGMFPEIGKALDAVAAAGALFAQMTGSGSTVFGVFTSKDSANDAYIKLCRNWSRCFLILASE